MKLIEPTIEYDAQIQAYRQEFLDLGGSMDGCGSLRRFDRTEDWLDQVEALKKPETTPPELVPMSQYIYVREEGKKVVPDQDQDGINRQNTQVISVTRSARASAGRAMRPRCCVSYCRSAKHSGSIACSFPACRATRAAEE